MAICCAQCDAAANELPAARAPGLVCTDKRAYQLCDASAAVLTTRINVLATEHGRRLVPRASIDEAVRDRELIVLAHRLIRPCPRRAGALQQPSPSSRPCTYTSEPSWRTRKLRPGLSRDRVAVGTLAPGRSGLGGLSPRNYACTAPGSWMKGHVTRKARLASPFFVSTMHYGLSGS
ncbi:hypothetical protein MTO96_011961 [Rhipicephalus appendiculatus]